ncbi:caudal [Leptinotarsa decemlineata]|uniref:caudal n=1 Tax=Leptinotarsa decemlineata TaxID=7539 RepID=UPI003D304CF6
MVYHAQTGPIYRHQSANGYFQTNSPMHSWYAYSQPAQLGAAPNPYCVQEEQQMWPHHHPHAVFPHTDFQDYMHTGIPPMQHPQHQLDPENHQLPSPPTTVSGSELSSPGGHNDNISSNSHNSARPPRVKSPFVWMKPSHHAQPNPGKTRTKDKYRVVYTDHQRIELEKEFTFVNKYITIRRKSELAANLGLSERQIKIWFQNRRAKERKQSKKRAEEKSQLEINPYQQNLQHMDMLAQHVPNPAVVMPTPSIEMHRYMDNQVMKHENSAS